MIHENQLSSFLTVIIQLASANRVAVLISHEPLPIAEYSTHNMEFINKSRVIRMVPHQNGISLRYMRNLPQESLHVRIDRETPSQMPCDGTEIDLC